MNKIFERHMESIMDSSNYERAQAMATNAYLKTNKFKKFLEPLSVMAEGNDKMSLHTSVGNGTVYVFVNIRDLEGFTGNEVEGLVNLFQYMNPSNMEVLDMPSLLSKEFRFKFNNVHIGEYLGIEVPVRVLILITAAAKEDSETCKRVVVGYTQPKEPEPIYKLECSEPDVGEING